MRIRDGKCKMFNGNFNGAMAEEVKRQPLDLIALSPNPGPIYLVTLGMF